MAACATFVIYSVGKKVPKPFIAPTTAFPRAFSYKHLSFRNPNAQDKQNLEAILQNKEAMQYYWSTPMTENDVNTEINYTITHPEARTSWIASDENNEPVGICGFNTNPPSLHYAIKPKNRGNGHATHIACALTALLFTTTDNQVLRGRTNKNNIASQNVLKKIGMKLVQETEHKKIFELKKADFLFSHPEALSSLKMLQTQ